MRTAAKFVSLARERAIESSAVPSAHATPSWGIRQTTTPALLLKDCLDGGDSEPSFAIEVHVVGDVRYSVETIARKPSHFVSEVAACRQLSRAGEIGSGAAAAP
jgi:hypothetical protein